MVYKVPLAMRARPKRRRLLMAVLMFGAGVASAQWARVYEHHDVIVYADTAAIKRAGNVVTMWHVNDLKMVRQTLITMSAGQEYQSTRVQQAYDCQNTKVRRLSFAAHSGKMGSGNAVLTDADASPWVIIAPDSVDAVLMKMACGNR